MIKTGVIHGRFQILHNDHLKYLMAGKARCRHLVVGITNPDPSLTGDDRSDPNRSQGISNPLTYYERYIMIREALNDVGLTMHEYSIVPFPINFPELYQYYVPLDVTFFLTIYDDWGRKKLELFHSIGLKTDILRETSRKEKGLSSDAIRKSIASGGAWKHLVPPSTCRLIQKWHIQKRLRDLYKKSY